MPVPAFQTSGLLPPGLYATSLAEVVARYGTGSEVRERQAHLLTLIVEAAKSYPTIKRVLVWGSFVTSKPEPNDLDYSIVVSVEHNRTQIAQAHRRFFIPFEARQFYGADTGYLVVQDYPLSIYTGRVDFICHSYDGECGIIEINLRGEDTGETK